MNYMLAFGSSEASLRLLWRFGLLEFLLPVQVCSFSSPVHILLFLSLFFWIFQFSYIMQASYFASQGFRRRDESYNMLLVSADAPSGCFHTSFFSFLSGRTIEFAKKIKNNNVIYLSSFFIPFSFLLHSNVLKVFINKATFWILLCSLCFPTLINMWHLINHVTVAYGKN